MSKRKFVISKDDFVLCLGGGNIPLVNFSESFQAMVRPLSTGSFVVLLDGFQENYGEKMLLTLWRCRGDNIDCLVAKIEIETIKSKLEALEEANLA